MKKILKTLVISFASIVMFASQSNAGELTVTGTAKATYNIIKGGDHTSVGNGTGKALGIANEIDFGASGELDNGYTWAYQVQFDPGDTAATAADGNANGVDDSRLTLTTPYGTFGAFQSEGDLRVENKGSQSVYARPTDIGFSTGINTTNDMGAYNNVQYHTAAGLLPYEIQVKAAYATGLQNTMNAGNAVGEDPSADGDGATMVQITATPIDGLKVGADYFKIDGAKMATADTVLVQANESGGIFVSYAYGAATIGASRSVETPTISRTAIEAIPTEIRRMDQKKYSVAYNLTDNTSISYERERGERENIASSALFDLTSNSFQLAHNMGGMTAAVAYSSHDNVGYRQDNDVDAVLVSVAMAF
jgi:hypothetical protein